MKKVRTELWIVSIVFLLLAGIVFIYSGLDSTGTTTPRGGQFQIEIGKALIGVLAVGLLGVWVKQLLDRLEKEREERSTRRIILRNTFDQLRKYSRQAITRCSTGRT